MTVLVIGAGGLLGSNVAVKGAERGEVVGTYHTDAPGLGLPTRDLDIREDDSVEAVVDEVNPDCIVNCAAKTDVDGCEFEPERAHAVNARAPGVIAAIAADRNIDFVHISTDYVFDGTATARYDEEATPNPVQMYGRSKLEGEQAVHQEYSESQILRLSFVYGIHRATGSLTGFPSWVRDRLDNGDETPLFTDQYITPTRAGQAAEVIFSLVARESAGLFHLACTSCVTPHEFGMEIRKRMHAPEHLITAGSMDDLERPAPRPENTCLDVSRLEETVGSPQPTLEDDLDAISGVFR